MEAGSSPKNSYKNITGEGKLKDYNRCNQLKLEEHLNARHLIYIQIMILVYTK